MENRTDDGAQEEGGAEGPRVGERKGDNATVQQHCTVPT